MCIRDRAVTGDDQHRYIPPFGDSGHLFQPGALPGGREHDEDVFGGQRLSKGKVLLVNCAGNAPLAQVAEPDGGIEGHRQAAALRDHLHDLAAAQQREYLPQLAGINGLNGDVYKRQVLFQRQGPHAGPAVAPAVEVD